MLSSFGSMPTLETSRLILRKLNMRDMDDIFEYSKDPEVAKYVLWSAQESIVEAKLYIRYMMRKYRFREPSSWGIALKETGKVIGTIGYMWYQDETASTEIGYSLSRAYWNQGIMTEALREVLRYSFEELCLHRVEAQHETENTASGVVMRKCGMLHEGTMRGRLYNKGRYVDVEIYAMLKEDWKKTR